MINPYRDFAPYFRNGRLYLPNKTLKLLADAGLDPLIVKSALQGFDLIDNRDQISVINRALETVLGTMEENTREFRALSSEEIQFMLTGKRTASV